MRDVAAAMWFLGRLVEASERERADREASWARIGVCYETVSKDARGAMLARRVVDGWDSVGR
jgi:hypothetical protein